MAKKKRQVRSATKAEREQIETEWFNVPESNRAVYDRRRVGSEPRTKVLDLSELNEISCRLRDVADQIDQTLELLQDRNRPGMMVDGVATLIRNLRGLERRANLIHVDALPLCNWEDRLTK